MVPWFIISGVASAYINGPLLATTQSNLKDACTSDWISFSSLPSALSLPLAQRTGHTGRARWFSDPSCQAFFWFRSHLPTLSSARSSPGFHHTTGSVSYHPRKMSRCRSRRRFEARQKRAFQFSEVSPPGLPTTIQTVNWSPPGGRYHTR